MLKAMNNMDFHEISEIYWLYNFILTVVRPKTGFMFSHPDIDSLMLRFQSTLKASDPTASIDLVLKVLTQY